MPFHCKILIDFVDNTGLTIQSDLVRFRHIFNVFVYLVTENRRTEIVNILDKNYNLPGSVNERFTFNFVLTFFTVSTIKSFMRSPSWCYVC